MYFLSVSSSRTQTQRGFLCLSTSVTLFLKFYSRCLGLCFTFTFKGIYLWVVDCWSLFISRSALRGYAAQSGSSLSSACHSARRPASLDCRRREGGKSTWPKACQYTPRGGTRQKWQLGDTCFCVSYHFTNHLHFIYVSLGTPTQSVKPVGLVRLRVKLAG